MCLKTAETSRKLKKTEKKKQKLERDVLGGRGHLSPAFVFFVFFVFFGFLEVFAVFRHNLLSRHLSPAFVFFVVFVFFVFFGFLEGFGCFNVQHLKTPVLVTRPYAPVPHFCNVSVIK